ncbi:MAG: glycine--tRNA ligase subunit beta [Aquificae bacterium]|nr:glycine--tRNA ligase subunit beta [Aquificota bacterium]
MNKLLIEIGTEELPASVILPALGFLKERLGSILQAKSVKTYGTPRRLALLFEDFPNERTLKEEVIFGPPKSVAFDEEGRPTRALEGFLRKNNASLQEVKVLKKNRGEYVAIVRQVEEKSPVEKIQESFEELLLEVPFPKRMRWTSSRRITFSRPVRWILALFNGQVLKLRFGEVESSNRTKGHRFLGREVELTREEDYERLLKENFVIPSYEERLGLVREGVFRLASQVGGEPTYPEGLLEEVTNLVEYPFPVLGSFEEKYLELPERVIVTVCAHHQRFFCIKKDGKLLNYFVGVSNNKPNEKIRKGYERVLRARLEDALFFYREDLKKDLSALVEELRKVIFHPRIGSVYDKVKRMEEIALRLCQQIGCPPETLGKVKEAVRLSKADLLTEMVKEFDELQGYMGYVYALKQGYDEEVARALWEQYRPSSPEDELPQTLTGSILSLADKIDNLYSFFKAGEVPRGSSDPYGLRRNAFGIIRILDSRGWNLDLSAFRNLYGDFKNYPRLVEFMAQRLVSYLEKYPPDIVRAVLKVHSPMKPYEVLEKVRKLYEASLKEEFPKLVESGKRVHRIIPEGWESTEVREELLQQREEKLLYEKLRELESRDIGDPLDLLQIKEYIDSFFDNVRVMAEEEELRRNRLALLKRVLNLFHKFGDFNEIVLKEGSDVSKQ